MTVIALTQEMGSLAKDVADKLAHDLGLAVMRHEVVDHVSSRMHVPTSLINRLREGKAGAIERLRADRTSFAVYITEELFEVAERGNVVLRGWGATAVLRPVPHVVCVRITRPFEKRVAWLQEQLGSDEAAHAEEEIRRSDRAHAARMHAQFGVTWGDPLLYDLVLNTDRVSVESCAEQIAALSRRPEFAETDASRAILRNMALEARVRSALRADGATQDVDVTVTSDAGHVVLSGMVLDPDELPAAARVAAVVPGVLDVDNQLRVMARSRLFPGGL
ncbi:MAG TPA: cytidylate kinase family protein [Caldimonas sp.]|nr:cytidylate kinase family protein [Caldimonas sp.]